MCPAKVTFLCTVNTKFPPDIVVDCDIPSAAQVQRDICNKGNEDCQPEPEVLPKDTLQWKVSTNPTPELYQMGGEN
jgi:hypothetical protein